MSLLEKAGAGRDYLGMEWKGNVSKQKEPFIKVVETPTRMDRTLGSRL
ncbi:MAG: hypothetical protein MZV70_43540 [Desulfobacterales bacterium]|nr:hypothetical protein [Desulfobacterales bacterium]